MACRRCSRIAVLFEVSPRSAVRAFSLIEVIIAVALFVGTVTVILALLPGLARQTTYTTDRLAAQRLPDAVRVELTRAARAGGLDALAARMPVMGDFSSREFMLAASRTGAGVQAVDDPSVGAGLIPVSERYFQVDCRRFSDGALRYESGQSVLALYVNVSWPYQANAAPAEASRHFGFVLSLNP